MRVFGHCLCKPFCNLQIETNNGGDTASRGRGVYKVGENRLNRLRLQQFSNTAWDGLHTTEGAKGSESQGSIEICPKISKILQFCARPSWQTRGTLSRKFPLNFLTHFCTFRESLSDTESPCSVKSLKVEALLTLSFGN